MKTALALASLAIASLGRAQQPAAPPPPDRYILIRCGTLLAIPGKDPVKNTTLVVKNGLVDRLSPGFDGPDLNDARQKGAKVQEVNLRESFVLPGLIDCHVHLTSVYDQSIRARYTTET